MDKDVCFSRRFCLLLTVAILTPLFSSCGVFDLLFSNGKSQKRDGGQGANSLKESGVLYVATSNNELYTYQITPSNQVVKRVEQRPFSGVITDMKWDAHNHILYVAHNKDKGSEINSFSLQKSGLTHQSSCTTLGGGETELLLSGGKLFCLNKKDASLTLLYHSKAGQLAQSGWRIALNQGITFSSLSIIGSPDQKEIFIPEKNSRRILHFKNRQGTPPIAIAGETITLPRKSATEAMIVDPKGQYAYVWTSAKKSILFRCGGGVLENIAQYPSPFEEGAIRKLSFSNDGKRVYILSHSQERSQLLSFSVKPGGVLKEVSRLDLPPSVSDFALSPDQNSLAVAQSNGILFYQLSKEGITFRQLPGMISLHSPKQLLWGAVK